MSPAVTIKDHWAEQRLFEQRSIVAALIIVLLTLTLGARLALLQVVRHDYYAQLEQNNRVRIEPIPAARGLILDRNGILLAGGQPAYQLELVREEVPDLEATLKGLVAIGMIAPEDLADVRRTILARRTFDSVPIRLRMSDEDVARFAVRRFDFPGVDIKTRQTRAYPYGELAVHALGYVAAISEQDMQHIDAAAYEGTTLIGKLGVESAYEKQLHGTNGHREIWVNAQGRSVEKIGQLTQPLHIQNPKAGEDLLLSLDLDVQRTAEEAMGTHRGAVVAIDPSTGDILALASLPDFDPALFARGITRAEYRAFTDNPDLPLLNRALRGTYPSGSTIKPALGLVALNDRVIDAERTLYCPGTFHLPNSRHIFRADKDEPRGFLALPEAIARSSDVYFYQLASMMGIERIDAGLAPFGYGRPTGIDIGGEKAGLLPTPEWKERVYKEKWVPGETVNMGIGQGYLLVTPLQVAHIAGVLAERGRNFRPRLVKGTRDAEGHVKWLAPVEDKPVSGISDAHWDVIIDAMKGTTHCERYCGTAAGPFKGAAYDAGGKTGTAQVYTVGQNDKYNSKTLPERLRDHAWFIAFAPVEAPRIAVAVLVENSGFGSANAAPIARKVMDAYLLGPDGKLKPFAVPPADEAAPIQSPKPERKPDQKTAGNALPRQSGGVPHDAPSEQ